MKIKWYGHASFRITDANGLSIITDPYTPELAGYEPFTEPADMVIISSDRDDYHCRADLIPGSPTVINALEVAQNGGSHQAHGITVHGIEVMEMMRHPKHEPMPNGMYRFEVDGIRVAHMGDVGNPLDDNQIAFLKDVDILLALAGDVPTIKLDDLKEAIDKATPKYVIPMHFRTLTYKPRDGFWIQSFLSYFNDDDVDFTFSYETELTKDDLPTSTRVLVMDYVR